MVVLLDTSAEAYRRNFFAMPTTSSSLQSCNKSSDKEKMSSQHRRKYKTEPRSRSRMQNFVAAHEMGMTLMTLSLVSQEER